MISDQSLPPLMLQIHITVTPVNSYSGQITKRITHRKREDFNVRDLRETLTH